ncbi:sulfite exporter TauE/SafE family protein [Labrenzia sp. PHM005]|uniref:sulfite exporter TauE/SafE family protein n=1 Tax=Labrenzia sp. PHM005 TaxID=2590016 RepID=UPI0011406E09|nr:sulfite exporter TauE/SafE family protein [Labrenzia sp. PHM005]QDG78114.1 sulfite exporter TauE/SafE family protein [Labrenzia sp. PHM005]
MDSFDLILIAFAVFFLAGVVKGVVGMGMPTISLGLMTVFVGVDKAIVLILWPTFLTNLWQAFSGGHLKILLNRLWPFLGAAALTLALGTFILTRAPGGAADLILGVLMIAYAVPMLFGLRLHISPAWQMPAGVFLGAVNGVFSGLTGSYTVPGVMYLQALGFNRDQLIQAMGLLFLSATIVLALALGGFGILDTADALQSLVLCVPALCGVYVGQHLRGRLSDEGFRRVFLGAILCLGIYLVPLGAVRLLG